MSNFSVAIEANEVAMNSAGSAMRENEVYMKSLEGRMNNLKSAFSTLANDVIRGEVVGALISLGTWIMDVINKTETAIPVLATLATGLIVAFTTMTGGTGLLIVGLIAGLTMVAKRIDDANLTFGEQKEIVGDLTAKVGELQTKYDALYSKEGKTENDLRQLDILQRQIDAQEIILANAKKLQDDMSVPKGIEDSNKVLVKAYDAWSNYIEIKRVSIDQTEKDESNAELLIEYEALLGKQYDLEESLKGLDGQNKIDIETQIAKNQRMLELIGSTLGMTKVVDENSEAIKNSTVVVSEAEQQFNALSLANDKVSESVQKSIPEIESLTEIINDMNAGNKMSSETMRQLLKDHPELRKELVKTDKGYELNVSSIEKLRDAQSNQSHSALVLQQSITNDLIEKTRARLTLYSKELSQIKTLAEAQMALAKMFSVGSAQRATENALASGQVEPSDDELIGYLSLKEQSTAKDLQILAGYYDELEGIQNDLIDLDLLLVGTVGDYETAQKKAEKATKEATKAKVAEIKTVEDYSEKLRQLVIDLDAYKLSLIEIEKTLGYLNTGDYRDKSVEQIMSLEDVNKAYTEQLAVLKVLYAEYDKLKSMTGTDLTDAITVLNNRIKEESAELTKLDKQLDTIQKNETERRKKLWEDNKKAILDNIKSQQELLKQYESDMNDLVDVTVDMLKQELDAEKQSYEDKKDLAQEAYDKKVEDLENYVDLKKKADEDELDALEKQHKAESKLIDDRLKKYKALIDTRKDAINDASSGRTYDQNLSQLNSELSDLETQGRSLANDDTATAQYLAVQDAISKKKLEIENLQYARSTELSIDALDDELKRFEDGLEVQQEAEDDKYEQEKEDLENSLDDWDDYLKDKKSSLEDSLNEQLTKYNDQIAKVDELLSQEGRLRNMALAELENNTEETYAKLLDYNKTYASGSDADIQKLWDNATSAVQRYGDSAMNVLGTIAKMQAESADMDTETTRQNNTEWEDVSDNVLTGKTPSNELTSKQSTTVESMKRGASNWQSADSATRKALEANNQKLGASIGADYDSASGIWYLNGKRLYHDGGIVGSDKNPPLKSNEEFAKLMDDEVIVTEAQVAKFMSQTMPNMMNANQSYSTTNNGGMSIGNLLTLNVTGDPSDDTISKMKRMGKDMTDNAVKEIVKIMGQTGHKVNAKTLSI